MDDSKNTIIGAIIIGVFILVGFWLFSSKSEDSMAKTQMANSADTLNSTPPSPAVKQAITPNGYCIDVTSYDYNWDNDMKCTRPDGSVFYTDYDGARQYEQGQ